MTTLSQEFEVQKVLDGVQVQAQAMQAQVDQSRLLSLEAWRSRKLLEATRPPVPHILEHIEQARRQMRTALRNLHRAFGTLAIARTHMERLTHRVQGGAPGSSKSKKSSAQKSASSGGGGDGGDGGDSDGPQRTPPEPKKPRSSRSRKSPLKHPPCISPGAIANTSPLQSPPQSRSPGLILLVLLYFIQCVFVIVLLLMGKDEIACAVLGSASIPALLEHLKKKPDKKG